MVIIERDGFTAFFSSLQERGYTLVGPVARGGAIVIDELHKVEDLASGYRAEQGPGRYRLTQQSDRAIFAQATGPQSWKKYLFPPSLKLFSARKNGEGFEVDAQAPLPARPYALLGVRPCDLHAIRIQDKVFLEGEYVDGAYRNVRDQALVIGVNCSQAGGTCFCASMKTGPRATIGFDLALTEVITQDKHFFVVDIGTDKGRQVLGGIPQRPAGQPEIDQAERIAEHAATTMGRVLDTANIRELLGAHTEDPRWGVTGSRCLSCANCTMVCPTCFCSSVEDVTDLTGTTADRWRRWDSCFTMDFSYIHGGSIRSSTKARYRQWMMHKLATWHDQFGTSGCVGCGRCITWCPVGIDITEEAQAIRAAEAGRQPTTSNEEKHHGNP